MDEKIPRIRRMINAGFSSSICNLKCSYCYISQIPGNKSSRIPSFMYSVKDMVKSLSCERLGGACLFNICANGETLLVKNIVDLIYELLNEGHYLEIVTNGLLSKYLKQISEFDSSLLKNLIFKFSFHYLELIRNNCLNEFIKNVKMMANAGSSYTIEVVPHDDLIPYIDEMKKVCIENFGALCHLTIARNHYNDMKLLSNMPIEKYYEAWRSFNSPMFDFKMSTFGVKRKEYCYAGDWHLNLNLENGTTSQCYCTRFTQNIFENIDKPIIFLPIGENCSLSHCVNSHALMAIGLIPEYKCITYAEVRNRKNSNGEEWLKKNIVNVYSQKLYENNKQYNNFEKAYKELYTRYIQINNKIKKMTKI